MAYRQPGVTVIEQFLNAVPALAAFALTNVVVGPAYQVKTKGDTNQNYTGTAANYTYPDQMAGTTIDTRPFNPDDLTTYPVRIFIQNAIVRLLGPNSTGAVSASDLNQFTDATLNVFANVVAGDVIVVTGPQAGSYTVRSVVNANTLQTNETFTAAGSGLNYTTRRDLGADGSDLEIFRSTLGVLVTETQVTLPPSLTTTVLPYGAVPIIGGTVLLSYRALRIEDSTVMKEYVALAQLQADYGVDQIIPENVAVFGIFLALSNSPTPVNLLTLGKAYLDTGSGTGDELIAYINAFNVLAHVEIYAISVMTQNTSVHTALKAHIDFYSTPEQKLERVGIINRQIVLTSVVEGPFSDGAVNASGLVFTSATAAFITSGVVPTQFINISAPSAQAGRYKIASVDSQTQVTLVGPPNGSIIPGGPVSGITFDVDRNLSLTEQAAVIAAYAHSIGDRRMVLTWPDIVKIPSGNVIRLLPGYFLNCAVGALTTGLPTQQGLTNLSVAVYVGVLHSVKYFSTDQLNLIADGGVMIFVQEVLDQTPIFIRHQLTTDRSAIKFQEYSVTKNVDFIAKFIRTNHQGFIGQYNIVDTTFDDLKTAAAGNIDFLAKKTLRPKIGAVIKSGTLTSIAQDPVNIDTIIETWNLNIPIPLNNLDITIVV